MRAAQIEALKGLKISIAKLNVYPKADTVRPNYVKMKKEWRRFYPTRDMDYLAGWR